MAKWKKNANRSMNKDYLTRDEYEEYLAGLYGMDFIAGFTDKLLLVVFSQSLV